jgi:hypothetical protein
MVSDIHPKKRKPRFFNEWAASYCREWSGRGDLNSRPPAPKAGALPGCATPRHVESYCNVRSVAAPNQSSHRIANLAARRVPSAMPVHNSSAIARVQSFPYMTMSRLGRPFSTSCRFLDSPENTIPRFGGFGRCGFLLPTIMS